MKINPRDPNKYCPACRKGGFKLGWAFDGRPEFKCTLCDNTWTCGHSGGEYLKYAAKEKEPLQ
jgi:transposase-like protein